MLPDRYIYSKIAFSPKIYKTYILILVRAVSFIDILFPYCSAMLVWNKTNSKSCWWRWILWRKLPWNCWKNLGPARRYLSFSAHLLATTLISYKLRVVYSWFCRKRALPWLWFLWSQSYVLDNLLDSIKNCNIHRKFGVLCVCITSFGYNDIYNINYNNIVVR